MHQAVLKNESIRDPGGSRDSLGVIFSRLSPEYPGSTLCFRKRKRKRAGESINAEKGICVCHSRIHLGEKEEK